MQNVGFLMTLLICEMLEYGSDEHNHGYDSSDTEDPFCNSDNTVIKYERFIDMFRKEVSRDEDTEMEDDHMESFLKTVVYNSDSDEGMDSLDTVTQLRRI